MRHFDDIHSNPRFQGSALPATPTACLLACRANGASHTSLGHRPRNTAQTGKRAESPLQV